MAQYHQQAYETEPSHAMYTAVAPPVVHSIPVSSAPRPKSLRLSITNDTLRIVNPSWAFSKPTSNRHSNIISPFPITQFKFRSHCHRYRIPTFLILNIQFNHSIQVYQSLNNHTYKRSSTTALDVHYTTRLFPSSQSRNRADGNSSVNYTAPPASSYGQPSVPPTSSVPYVSDTYKYWPAASTSFAMPDQQATSTTYAAGPGPAPSTLYPRECAPRYCR
ncbi:hypothetical protein BDZ97DRAFT_860012 [Flammula alnicola]|nr:hypothetical protein BDZ97DRAFT_860012 [Flammula alnicola]